MWLSLDAASSLFDGASIGLIASAAILVVSTIAVWWSGNIKEEYLRRDVAAAHERAAEANARAAEAKQHAAALEVEALALKQSLSAFARRSGERILDFQQFLSELKAIPKRNVEVWYIPDDDEAESFSNDVHRALQIAGWPTSRRTLKPQDELGGMPLAKMSGVTVISRNPDDIRRPDNLMFAIIKGIRFGGQAVGTTAPELPNGKIVVVIGARVKL